MARANISNTKPKREELRAALQQLHLVLDDAYWAAINTEDKDRISGVKALVYDLSMEMFQLEIEDRTAELKDLRGEMNDAVKSIKKIKQDIDDLIKAVKTATKVAKAVDQVVEAAAKIFL